MVSLEVRSTPELQFQELNGRIRVFLGNGGLIGLG